MSNDPGIYIGPKGDIYVGPDIQPGQPFDGNAMRYEDGTKNYSHFGPNGELFRAPGVPGDQSPKW